MLLLIAGIWLKDKPQNGLILGAVVSFTLAGWFGWKFIQKHTWMPAGMMSILSIIAIILTALAFVKK